MTLVAKGNKLNAPPFASFFPSFPIITTIHHHHTPLLFNKVRKQNPPTIKLNALILTTHVFLKITWRKMARIKKFICEKTIIIMLTKHTLPPP
jgi:hypothetical protein